MTIEEMEKEGAWPPNTIATLELVPYVKRMGRGIKIVDVRCGKGEELAFLLENCPNIKHAIAYKDGIKDYDDILEKNLRRFGNKVEIVTNKNAFKTRKDFDFVFIHPTPSQHINLENLDFFHKKTKRKGLISITNCREGFVYSAIVESRRKYKTVSFIHNLKNNTWFWFT